MNFDRPHRRYNLLTRQWVLVSPHRAKRPWLGQVEKIPPENLPSYDPGCYLCPGNDRSTGNKNPDYTGTFVFDNDFASLLPPEAVAEAPQSGMFTAEPENGSCKVVCFSPRHDQSIPEMPLEGVAEVIRTWRAQSMEIAQNDSIRYVQVFENKGAVMGCSNPHPHSQIWALGHVPNEITTESESQSTYLKEKGTCLLCDYLKAEAADRSRIVGQNDHFTAVVPFWAVWPFEVMVISHRHIANLEDLTEAEIVALADVYRQVATRYDNLFEISFPYSMGFHQSPCDHQDHPEWHLHMHFYPPLLRSATVRKFMVGFEMMAMPQRDLTAETAAERLRSMELVHYKSKK